MPTAITPTREENYPEWYQQVIRAADLAEPSPVRGCMVIKPWGYAIWENIQRRLDAAVMRFICAGFSIAERTSGKRPPWTPEPMYCQR